MSEQIQEVTKKRPTLLNILNGNSYLSVNRSLLHSIGIFETILLSEIINKYEYFKNINQLECIDGEFEWFYLTIDDVYERTALSRKQQDSAIKTLIDLGFIKIKVKGIPPKRFFYLDQEALFKYFSKDENINKNESTNLYQTDKLNCTKRTNRIVPNGQIHIYKKQDLREQNKRKDNVSRKNSQDQTMEPVRQFRLTEEQRGVFDWLKHRIKNTEDETLCYWAKTYEFSKIDSAYSEAISRKPNSLGAYISKLLKDGVNLPNAKTEQCREFAKEFISNNQWEDVKLDKKYLIYGKGKEKSEISLMQEPDVFARQLLEVYSNQKRKGKI